ncbi:hypothetical protein ACFLUZ_06390 [Chloroflexota bacterium]
MKSEKGFLLIETLPALSIRAIVVRLRSLVYPIIVAITLLSFALPTPVAARGLAISGTFYRQHFQLFPGETLRTPDIYLVVFNREDEDIRVKLTTQAPPGVEIMLDQSYFPIPPGEQRKIEVGVSIGTEAVPGEYLLAIGAEIQPAEGEGITIVGAAEQRAKLTILGEAGPVQIAVDMIPIAQSCSIYGFSVVPNYHDDTDKIAFVDIGYAIENTAQPLKSANVILSTSFNNELLEQIEIISLPMLDPGNTKGSYKYIPPQGWQDGIYAFKLELFSQDKVCAESPEEELLEGKSPDTATGIIQRINWSLIGAAVGGWLFIVFIVLMRKKLSKIVPVISALSRPKKKAIHLENPQFSGVFDEKTGEIVIAKISYNLNNQHKPMPGVRVELQACKGTTPFENITLVTLDPLEKGLINLEYDYAPAEGWQKNTPYRFKLALYIADELCAITPVNARAKPAS